MDDGSTLPTHEVVLTDAQKVQQVVAQIPLPQYQREALGQSLLSLMAEGTDITDTNVLRGAIKQVKVLPKRGRAQTYKHGNQAKAKARRKQAKASRRRNRG